MGAGVNSGRAFRTSLTFAWAPPSCPPFLCLLERRASPLNPGDTEYLDTFPVSRSLPLLLMAVRGRLWFISTAAVGPIEKRGGTVRQVVGRRRGT